MEAEPFLDAARVAAVTQGELRGEAGAIKDVVIDDREVTGGSLYVPIIGERLDGHAFIDRAFDRGAALTLSDRDLETDHPYVLVPDTLTALQQLAAFWMAHYQPFTVAVTGSVGKTSTKELVASVLSQGLTTKKTQGNLNNQTGVPKTVFGIGPDTQAAVIEMGMNHAGEIDRIARIAAPDVGIITNIGTAHIEHLGSQEGIFAAKSELVDHVKPQGLLLVNGDDPYLPRLRSREDLKGRVLLFGFSPAYDVYADEILDRGLEGSEATLHLQDGATVRAVIPAPGRYMIAGALAAAAAGAAAGLGTEQIARGIAAYRPAGARMRIAGGNNLRILDDTYNANAPAMIEALRILSGVSGRSVAILGDMLELGPESGRLHREVGQAARAFGIDALYTVGPQARAIREGAGDLPGRAYETQEELLDDLSTLIRSGDTVLVKASRGMHLEKTVAALEDGEH